MCQDWVAELDKQRRQILQEGQKIYIVNAGRMNHGKSSLFNSLLDQHAFEVEDIRTTVNRKDVEFGEDVVVVDTPGLDAEEGDDDMAFAAYRRANLIVFVHTVKTGAVERDEIASINRMEAESPSADYFWKHFVLVFTSLDEYNTAEDDDKNKMDKIEAESLKNVLTGCGHEGFPVFRVSNTRYQKGKELQKDKLIELSGIKALKDFILSNLDTWKHEQGELNEFRFAKAKQEILALAQQERDSLAKKMEDKKCKWDSWKSEVKRRVDIFSEEIDNLYRSLRQAKSEYQSL